MLSAHFHVSCVSRLWKCQVFSLSSRCVFLDEFIRTVWKLHVVDCCATQDTIQRGGDKDVPAMCDLLREKEFAKLKVSVEGHTSFGLEADAARKLSEGRARQIKIRLTSLGIERERIETVGFGIDKPRYDHYVLLPATLCGLCAKCLCNGTGAAASLARW